MRRTKEDAQQTRRRIIAAARDMFARRGVSRTSLEQIARAAGVTRGAIYWHFANKTELFYAMREEVALPIVDRIGLALERRAAADALQGIEALLLEILDTVVRDPCARKTFQIIAFNCEYVGEFERELRNQAKGHRELYARLVQAYHNARQAGTLRARLKPELAALETCAFLSGLLRLWLLDDKGTLVRSSAARLISAHMAGRRKEKHRPASRA